MSEQIYIRKVNKEQLANDLGATMILAAFYGLEMQKSMNWTVEQRWGNLSKTQANVGTGESVMLMAENHSKMPIGMLVYTQTDNKDIRRIESLFVFEPFRRQGVAKKLLEAAKENKEFHTYAIPSSVPWYKHNGFRVVGEHSEGTIEMTTADYSPEYSFKTRAPIPTEFDKEFIENMKEFESRIKR